MLHIVSCHINTLKYIYTYTFPNKPSCLRALSIQASRLSPRNTYSNKPGVSPLAFTRSDQNRLDEEKQPHRDSASHVSISNQQKAKDCAAILYAFAKNGNSTTLEQFHSMLIRHGFSSRQTTSTTQTTTTTNATYSVSHPSKSTQPHYQHPHVPADVHEKEVFQSLIEMDETVAEPTQDQMYDIDVEHDQEMKSNDKTNGNTGNHQKLAMELNHRTVILPGSGARNMNNGNVMTNNNLRVVKDQKNKPKLMNTLDEHNVNNVNNNIHTKTVKGNGNENEIGSNDNNDHDMFE